MTPNEVRGLISLLLSSGSMALHRSPAGGYVRLTLTAGMQDAAYLQEKVDEVRQFLPGGGDIQTYRSGPAAIPNLRFRVTAPDLRVAYNLLYPGHNRRITSTVLELCGARALAWYWSDWLKPEKGGNRLLGHVGRTDAEAVTVGHWMATILGVESELACSTQKPHRPCLRISAQQVSKGASLLLDYCPATRLPWFQDLIRHDHCLHESSALLLPGGRIPESQGPTQQALVGVDSPGTGGDLPTSSAQTATRKP